MKPLRPAARKVKNFFSDRLGIRIVPNEARSWTEAEALRVALMAQNAESYGNELTPLLKKVADDLDKDTEAEALRVVSVMEKYNGKKLTPLLKKVADDYAIQVLGGKEYAPWLYVYALMSDGFKEGWIPSNFYGRFVVPKANKDLDFVVNFKTLSNAILKTHALPDIAYYIDGIFYTRGLEPTDAASIQQAIGEGYPSVFVKKDGSERGQGIIKLPVIDINENRFRQIGNSVIQSPIQQHEFFDCIISDSVATIRITTAKDAKGRIDMRASFLRVGRAGDEWVQAAKLIRVAIINGHGELDCFCYTPDWRRWVSHPDTNFSFSGKLIPHFGKAVETCRNLHALVPHLTIIGWDIAIGNDDQVKLIEWNARGDIKFSEAATGPCFIGLNWESLRA
jgi:hypothetical protein